MTCPRGQAGPLRFCFSHSTRCSAHHRLPVTVGRCFPSPVRPLCVAWVTPNTQLPTELARGPGYLCVICISLGDPTQILAHQTWVALGTGHPGGGETQRVPCAVRTGSVWP